MMVGLYILGAGFLLAAGAFCEAKFGSSVKAKLASELASVHEKLDSVLAAVKK